MKKLTLLIISICFVLVGCTDYVEVEDLTIVTAVAIDFDEQDTSLYRITIEVLKFPNDTAEVTLVQATGVTFSEAIANAIKITGNDLYFSHTQAIIISEEIASDSIYPFIDFAYRNTSFRLNTAILIAKDVKASEILSANSLIDDIAGVQIKKIVDSNQLISEVPSMSIYEFIDDMSTVGVCGMLPIVTLKNASEDQVIREMSGFALFDGDKMAEVLDEKQTKTLGVLQNKAKTGNVINEYSENTDTFNLVSSKTEIKPVYKDGQISFVFDVKMELELVEQVNGLDTLDDENQQKMQDEITIAVKKDIEQLINLQKQYSNCDFLALTNLFYRNYPQTFENFGDDFEKVLENLDYTLNVECKLSGTGLMSSPIIIEN